MLFAVEVVVVAAIVFAVAALAVGRFDRMAPAPPDAAGDGLPDGPLEPADVVRARFGMALRGYRMAEVDTVLERLAWEMARRDAEIARLSGRPGTFGLAAPTAAANPTNPTNPSGPSGASPASPLSEDPPPEAPRTGGLFRTASPVAAELFRPAETTRTADLSRPADVARTVDASRPAEPARTSEGGGADPASGPLPRRRLGVRDRRDGDPGAAGGAGAG